MLFHGFIQINKDALANSLDFNGKAEKLQMQGLRIMRNEA